MKRGSLTHAVIAAGLLLAILATPALGKSDQADPNRYLNAVREFADNVLKYGRDTYGPKQTPLFVDGLNIHTHEPVKWIAPNGDRWILSNLASQQNLFRTLDGLTAITGDAKYKQAAMGAIKYAFENLRSRNGLLYWGGHSAYDAGADKPCGRGVHEFKSHYPYYELMWQTDPNATRGFIGAFWSGHIRDWSNLDMSRHCYQMNQSLEKPWKYEFKGGPVFFESKESGVSFLCTGSDLFHGAALLTKLSGDGEPLVWAKRLAHRYVETRDPNTGIAAYVYTGKRTKTPTPKELKDDGLKGLAYGSCFPYSPTFGDPDRRRLGYGYCTVSPGIPFNLAVSPWICALLVGKMMGSDGKEFVQWSVEELTARGKVAYRMRDNSWTPILLNGTPLEGLVLKQGGPFGPEGTLVQPIRAVPMDFWAYALAYGLTGNDFMWQMA
jgi:pectate lyase